MNEVFGIVVPRCKNVSMTRPLLHIFLTRLMSPCDFTLPASGLSGTGVLKNPLNIGDFNITLDIDQPASLAAAVGFLEKPGGLFGAPDAGTEIQPWLKTDKRGFCLYNDTNPNTIPTTIVYSKKSQILKP